jgi:hypothetical protein
MPGPAADIHRRVQGADPCRVRVGAGRGGLRGGPAPGTAVWVTRSGLPTGFIHGRTMTPTTSTFCSRHEVFGTAPERTTQPRDGPARSSAQEALAGGSPTITTKACYGSGRSETSRRHPRARPQINAPRRRTHTRPDRTLLNAVSRDYPKTTSRHPHRLNPPPATIDPHPYPRVSGFRRCARRNAECHAPIEGTSCRRRVRATTESVLPT